MSPASLRIALSAAALAVAPLLAAQPARAESVAVAPDRLDAVIAAAQAWLGEGRSPGLAIGVMQGDRIVLARGLGMADLERNAPVTADTVFRIGSVTKQFTAAALLRLAEQGRLSLDDPLDRYLPGLSPLGTVSLRRLLDHSAGVSSYTDADLKPREGYAAPRDRDAMIALIRGFRPPYRYAPATAWRYSNSGFYLAGVAAEKVTGQPLGAYLADSFFKPLGLTRTAMDDERDVIPGRASGYRAVAGGFVHADGVSMSVPAGAGAMRSTIGDLLHWQRALMTGRAIAPASLAVMVEPARLADGSLARRAPGGETCRVPQYGLGQYVDRPNGIAKVAHGGSINGFRAYLASYPERELAFVILSNGEGELTALTEKVEAALIGAPDVPACAADAVARISAEPRK